MILLIKKPWVCKYWLVASVLALLVLLLCLAGVGPAAQAQDLTPAGPMSVTQKIPNLQDLMNVINPVNLFQLDQVSGRDFEKFFRDRNAVNQKLDVVERAPRNAGKTRESTGRAASDTTAEHQSR